MTEPTPEALALSEAIYEEMRRNSTHSGFINYRAAIIAAYAAALPQWRGMESAPKDGTKVDLLYPFPRGRMIDAYWDAELGGHWVRKEPRWEAGNLLPEKGWYTVAYPNTEPLAWMPLPPPPVSP